MEAPERVLIDTSVLIAHLRGQIRLHEKIADDEQLYISAITVYELEYGARRAGRASDLDALRRWFTILPFDEAAARKAAEVQAKLVRKNKRIGDRDVLIAGTALVHDLALMTRNVREYRRVPGLRVVSI